MSTKGDEGGPAFAGMQQSMVFGDSDARPPQQSQEVWPRPLTRHEIASALASMHRLRAMRERERPPLPEDDGSP